jgi:hypothetical protein
MLQNFKKPSPFPNAPRPAPAHNSECNDASGAPVAAPLLELVLRTDRPASVLSSLGRHWDDGGSRTSTCALWSIGPKGKSAIADPGASRHVGKKSKAKYH